MEPVLGEHVIDGIVVAASAELKAFFLDRKRFGGGRTFMALPALLARKGLMGRIVNHPSTIRTVHIVTHRAFAVFHRVVRVLLDEEGLFRIVALLAESRDVAAQQCGGLGGSMGIMAIDAPFLNRRMLEFHLLDLLTLFLMAPVAEIIACRTQVILVVRSVRIMALNALAFQDDLMGAARVRRQDS
jgi:hypothetical protein